MNIHLVNAYTIRPGYEVESCMEHIATNAFLTLREAEAFATQTGGDVDTIAVADIFTLDELALIVSAADALTNMMPATATTAEPLRELRAKVSSLMFNIVAAS